MSLQRWNADDDRTALARFDASASSSSGTEEWLSFNQPNPTQPNPTQPDPTHIYPLFGIYIYIHIYIYRHDARTSGDSESAHSASSNESTSLSDSETDNGSGCGDPTIDLTLERLQSLHTAGTVQKGDLSEYAKTGMSPTRIKSALKQPVCTCYCKLPVKLLYQLCVAFWTLTKSSQDSLLWSLQHEGGKHRRKQWHLGGL